MKWWLSEIGDLLHVDFLKTPPDATIIRMSGGDPTVFIRVRGKISPAGQISSSDGFTSASEDVDSWNDRPAYQVLWLPDSYILKRRLTIATAARDNLAELLGYEIERETPFSADEIYWGYLASRADKQSQHIQVQLAVIPKAATENLVGRARAAGFEPNGFEMELEGFGRLFIPFVERRVKRRPPGPLASRRLLIATGGLATVAISLPFLFQTVILAKLDRQIAFLEVDAKQAAVISSSIDQLKKTNDIMRKERRRTGSALETLAHASILIPDDSYLTGLDLHKQRLTLSGLSPSAAKLIALFAKSSSFRDPSFTSPVVENQDGGLETFTIAVTPNGGAW